MTTSIPHKWHQKTSGQNLLQIVIFVSLLVLPSIALADVDYYTWGGAGPINAAFQRVAFIFSASNFKAFMTGIAFLSLIIGGVGAVLNSIGGKPQTGLMLFVPILLGSMIYAGFFVPKETVYIYDPVLKVNGDPVPGVPIAVSRTSYLLNLVERGVIKMLDENPSTIGEPAYQEAGIIGFDVLGQSAKAMMGGSALSQTISAYTKDCVVFEMSRDGGTLSADDLMCTPAGKSFIDVIGGASNSAVYSTVYIDTDGSAIPSGKPMACDLVYSRIKTYTETAAFAEPGIKSACESEGFMNIGQCRNVVGGLLTSLGSVTSGPSNLPEMLATNVAAYVTTETLMSGSAATAATFSVLKAEAEKGAAGGVTSAIINPRMINAYIAYALVLTPVLVLFLVTPMAQKVIMLIISMYAWNLIARIVDVLTYHNWVAEFMANAVTLQCHTGTGAAGGAGAEYALNFLPFMGSHLGAFADLRSSAFLLATAISGMLFKFGDSALSRLADKADSAAKKVAGGEEGHYSDKGAAHREAQSAQNAAWRGALADGHAISNIAKGQEISAQKNAHATVAEAQANGGVHGNNMMADVTTTNQTATNAGLNLNLSSKNAGKSGAITAGEINGKVKAHGTDPGKMAEEVSEFNTGTGINQMKGTKAAVSTANGGAEATPDAIANAQQLIANTETQSKIGASSADQQDARTYGYSSVAQMKESQQKWGNLKTNADISGFKEAYDSAQKSGLSPKGQSIEQFASSIRGTEEAARTGAAIGTEVATGGGTQGQKAKAAYLATGKEASTLKTLEQSQESSQPDKKDTPVKQPDNASENNPPKSVNEQPGKTEQGNQQVGGKLGAADGIAGKDENLSDRGRQEVAKLQENASLWENGKLNDQGKSTLAGIVANDANLSETGKNAKAVATLQSQGQAVPSAQNQGQPKESAQPALNPMFSKLAPVAKAQGTSDAHTQLGAIKADQQQTSLLNNVAKSQPEVMKHLARANMLDAEGNLNEAGRAYMQGSMTGANLPAVVNSKTGLTEQTKVDQDNNKVSTVGTGTIRGEQLRNLQKEIEQPNGMPRKGFENEHAALGRALKNKEGRTVEVKKDGEGRIVSMNTNAGATDNKSDHSNTKTGRTTESYNNSISDSTRKNLSGFVNQVFDINERNHSRGDNYNANLLQQMLTPGGNSSMAEPTINSKGRTNQAGVDYMAAQYAGAMGAFIQKTGVNANSANIAASASVGASLSKFGISLGGEVSTRLQKATESKDSFNMQSVAYQAVTAEAAAAAEKHRDWTPKQKQAFVGDVVSSFTALQMENVRSASEKGFGVDRVLGTDKPNVVKGNNGVKHEVPVNKPTPISSGEARTFGPASAPVSTTGGSQTFSPNTATPVQHKTGESPARPAAAAQYNTLEPTSFAGMPRIIPGSNTKASSSPNAKASGPRVTPSKRT